MENVDGDADDDNDEDDDDDRTQRHYIIKTVVKLQKCMTQQGVPQVLLRIKTTPAQSND